MRARLLLLLLCFLPSLIASRDDSHDSSSDSDDDEACPSLPLSDHLLEFYIGGKWVAPTPLTAAADDETTTTTNSSSFQTMNVINPSTEESIATIALGSLADTNAAVQAARDALSTWSQQTSIPERIALVEQLLHIYDQRQEEMAQLISAEMGAPLDFAREAQVGSGLYHIEQFLQAMEYFEPEKLLPGVIMHDNDNENNPTTLIFQEPVGVVALITPWNWPMNQVTLKVIPALLVGCTCILKPSEVAPLSSLLFAEMIHQAGFPPGVFNLVNGDGVGVGTQLSSHMHVDMISFTGSTRAGKLISQAAALSNLKKTSLELGGKGANIIFADIVDDGLQDIVKAGVWSCFDNSGQSCNAPTRMLVERSIYDTAIQIANDTIHGDDIVFRPAHHEGDFYGPVSSRVQYERVQRYIQLGMDEGATLVAGGLGRPDGVTRGYFVRPTIFADVTPDMTIMQEEIFGPVLSIMPFDTEEEALEIANGTPYGLSNYFYTRDKSRRRRLAKSLKSGMVEINGIGADEGAPFAAVRASGNGREGGLYGLEDFCVIKVVSGM
ncbi:Aldehyde dehydrogenase [Seminavis robusta]|uniref:aldehyde dehydrogenase (NAD(+)) n=1 Tax=Seminavis robusta TaxID=568900 RepID=A0A9N8DXW7_9STRA|nr:Aldehyde dehydrogenase [Seminavis robusta]|eukprot:Sro460_g147600.1 Aldehyde dehydrogenase (552) ;mRNA; r:52934-54589